MTYVKEDYLYSDNSSKLILVMVLVEQAGYIESNAYYF